MQRFIHNVNFLIIQFRKHFLRFERDFASFQLEALVCTELSHLVLKCLKWTDLEVKYGIF